MNYKYIGWAIGYVGVVLMFISYLTKSPKKLLILQNIGVCCTIMQYFFVGADSGFILNIGCLVRNMVYFFSNKVKPFRHPACGYVLALLMGVLGYFSWEGPISLLIIIALMINTVFMSFNNNQLLRISVIFTCTMILIYNLEKEAIPGAVNEGLSIVSAIIGICKYRKQSA